MKEPTILKVGLFGTCGKSLWRNIFKERYAELGIPFFDPVRPDWKEEYATEEARHLATDSIIVFAITSETYATGSLSEIGFSVAQVMKLDHIRYLIVMIDQKLDPELDDPIARRESLRARALAWEHLKELNLDNVYIVDTLKEMLDVSIGLFQAEKTRESLSVFTHGGKQ